jgi:L-fuculose-phosphate aldolase
MAWEAQRRQVAHIMRRLYHRRLTNPAGGNVSCRAADGSIVVTASGGDKACLRAEDVAVLDPDGRNLTPQVRPTSESPMHLRIYQVHPSVGAVVHAHPVTAGAFTCAETPIDIQLLCETYALLEQPVVVPYTLTGTAELADKVAAAAGQSSSILVQNHGVLTTGADLLQAFTRLELLDEAARVTLISRQLDGVRHLTPTEMADLDRLMGR